MKKSERPKNPHEPDPAKRRFWPRICTKRHVREAAIVTARGIRAVFADINNSEDKDFTVETVIDLSQRLSEMKGLINDLELRKERDERLEKLKSIYRKLYKRLCTIMAEKKIDLGIIHDSRNKLF